MEFSLLHDVFLDILLVFIYLPQTYFYIYFFLFLFLHLFLYQKTFYLYFELILAIFLCCFYIIILLFHSRLADDNSFVLVLEISFWFFNNKYSFLCIDMKKFNLLVL